MHVFKVTLTLSAHSDFTVAITTVYRTISAGLEWYFGVFATLGAYCREHRALGPSTIAIVTETLCFPRLATFRTALRLISIALRLEELLFLNAESEGSSTIGALE